MAKFFFLSTEKKLSEGEKGKRCKGVRNGNDGEKKENRDERINYPIHWSVFTFPIKNSLIALFKPIHHLQFKWLALSWKLVGKKGGRVKSVNIYLGSRISLVVVTSGKKLFNLWWEFFFFFSVSEWIDACSVPSLWKVFYLFEGWTFFVDRIEDAVILNTQ